MPNEKQQHESVYVKHNALKVMVESKKKVGQGKDDLTIIKNTTESVTAASGQCRNKNQP